MAGEGSDGEASPRRVRGHIDDDEEEEEDVGETDMEEEDASRGLGEEWQLGAEDKDENDEEEDEEDDIDDDGGGEALVCGACEADSPAPREHRNPAKQQLSAQMTKQSTGVALWVRREHQPRSCN